MDISLKTLVSKFNDTTRAAAARAANLCMGLGQYEIDIEHLFLALLEQPGSDLACILRHSGVAAAQLEADLRAELAHIPDGNSRTPVFARHLPTLFEHAWLLASLKPDQPAQIRSGHWLLALLTEPGLAQLAQRSSPCFARIPLARLKHEFEAMTAGSQEAVRLPPPAPEAAVRPMPALERYTLDLSARARAGQLDPVIGRDQEIAQLIDILLRRRQNNPILTGEPGVGKTAVVEGLALKIAAGEVPDMFKPVALRSLDMGLLQAGASVKGEFESRLQAVIEEVQSSSQPIILFIDEAHTLVGAGGAPGQNDAANLLKPALARGELRTIAATTWAEYKRYFEKDAALARRFQVVKVEEPDEASCCAMLRALVAPMEQHFGLRILDEAVEQAVRLAQRYLSERQLPDKAIGVLDTACARLRASIQQSDPAHRPEIDGAAVAAVVAAWTGIPLGRMLKDDLGVVSALESLLSARVVGQPHVAAAIGARIRSARARLDDPARPQAVFLFAGPSGVGKTETALALAEALFGGERKLITINMSEYQEAHSVSGLKGAPPGYVGYGAGGVLTEAVRRQPYSVVLLDEFEKAHADVRELFYQVFDKGRLDDAEGRSIDFRHCVIIATTNIGAGQVLQACAAGRPDPDTLRALVQPLAAAEFKAPLLGRMSLLPFYPLGSDSLAQVVNLKLGRVAERLQQQHRADFHYDQELVAAILQRCDQPDAGARHVDALLARHLLPSLADTVLAAMGEGRDILSVQASADTAGRILLAVDEA